MPSKSIGYSIDPRIQRVAEEYAGGALGGTSEAGIHVRPWSYWHAKDYAAAGTTSETFFNVGPSPNVCNLPTNGTIEANTAFLCQSIHFKLTSGKTIAGAAVTNGEQIDSGALQAVDLVEDLRNVLVSNSEITFSVAERQIIHELGLDCFPWGGGADVSMSIAATGAGAVINNGVAHASNGYAITPNPWIILPGQQIRLNVRFPALVPTDVAATWTWRLRGLLVSASN